ncbi:MAG: SPOR domain-containing protein [Candidatus Sumerlaeia bacterium]|nr:SPOR domain-containing protein [Candidatus Sumerlaeia bacterium]
MKRNWTALAVGMAMVCMAGAQEGANPPAPTGQVPGDVVYGVQVGAFPGEASAEACMAAYQSRGYHPVYVLPETEDRLLRVVYGCFSTYMEAFLYREHFRSSGVEQGAFVRQVPALAAARTENAGELPSVFGLDERSLEGAGRVWGPEVSGIATDRGRSQLRQAFEDAEGASGTSRAVLQLAEAQERVHQADRAGALDLQMQVARGEIPASPSVRLQACWDAARSLRHTNRRVEAYAAYRELAELCPEPLDRAACHVQAVAMLFELAGSDHGSYSDVRLAANRALAAIPASGEDFLARRATIELMGAETYLMEGNRQTAAARMAEVEQHYRNVPAARREVGSALSIMADCLIFVGRIDEARQACERLLEMRILPEENFRGFDVDANAAASLYTIAVLERDSGERDRWADFLRENHPEYWERNSADLLAMRPRASVSEASTEVE